MANFLCRILLSFWIVTGSEVPGKKGPRAHVQMDRKPLVCLDFVPVSDPVGWVRQQRRKPARRHTSKALANVLVRVIGLNRIKWVVRENYLNALCVSQLIKSIEKRNYVVLDDRKW